MSVVLPEIDLTAEALQITPLFQPVVDLRHGVAAGYEMLSRGPEAALGAIAKLPRAMHASHSFFLNVSPDVSDGSFTRAALEERGISIANIVVEISERATFKAAVRHYARQGFQIALDDFGAGDSDLLTLISCAPDYLELDIAVTRDINRVRSMAALAQNIGAVLIAQGVETWSEAETLMRCGVQWAEGSLFGRPAPQPERLSPEVSRRVMRASRR
jgi:EAL domain-containing protein (putative c-di-GMP-specific phosphodiesterase class I)